MLFSSNPFYPFHMEKRICLLLLHVSVSFSYLPFTPFLGKHRHYYPTIQPTPLSFSSRSIGRCHQVAWESSLYSNVNGDNNKDALSEEEKKIQAAYKLAMEEDEEWYNEFVTNILQQPDQQTSTTSDKEKGGNENKSIPTMKKDMKKDDGVGITPMAFKEVETKVSSFPKKEEEKQEWSKENGYNTKNVSDQNENDALEDEFDDFDEYEDEDEDDDYKLMMQMEQQLRDEKSRKDMEKPDDTTSNNPSAPSPRNTVTTAKRQEKLTEKETKRLEALGYSKDECESLAMDAMDLILQDSIQRPKSGIPIRWRADYDIFEDDDNFEEDVYEEDDDIFLLKKDEIKEVDEIQSQREKTDSIRPLETKLSVEQKGTEKESPPKSEQFSSQPQPPTSLQTSTEIPPSQSTERDLSSSLEDMTPDVRDISRRPRTDDRPRKKLVHSEDEDSLEPPPRRRRPPPPQSSREGPQRQRRSSQSPEYSSRPRPSRRPRPRRRQSLSSSSSSPPSSSKIIPQYQNKIWPTQSTFESYLRREAQLRLAILGPSWKSWVKNESQWRLNLYKDWLRLLDQGVGEDVITSGRSRPKRRSSGSIRKNRRRFEDDDDDDEEDDDYYDDEEEGSPSRRTRRRRRRQNDDEDEDDGRRRRRRRVNGDRMREMREQRMREEGELADIDIDDRNTKEERNENEKDNFDTTIQGLTKEGTANMNQNQEQEISSREMRSESQMMENDENENDGNQFNEMRRPRRMRRRPEDEDDVDDMNRRRPPPRRPRSRQQRPPPAPSRRESRMRFEDEDEYDYDDNYQYEIVRKEGSRPRSPSRGDPRANISRRPRREPEWMRGQEDEY